MTNVTPTQQLFAALKPEDSLSTKAINDATKAAEQRWPLLKSLAPEKWAIAPPISEPEKLRRNRLEPIEVVARKPAASAPNINAQLANALNRMAAPKPPALTKPPLADITAFTTIPTVQVAPITATTTGLNSAPKEESISNAAPVFIPTTAPAMPPSKPRDNSILSVLQRVEKANEPEPIASEKVPGFLARLGKK